MNLSNVTGQQMVVNVSHTVLLRANKLNYASHSSSKTFTFVHYKHLFCKLNSRIPILKVNIPFNLLRFKQFDCSKRCKLNKILTFRIGILEFSLQNKCLCLSVSFICQN
jgi:hypothetical protein